MLDKESGVRKLRCIDCGQPDPIQSADTQGWFKGELGCFDVEGWKNHSAGCDSAAAVEPLDWRMRDFNSWLVTDGRAG
jgi:hypothetical protein